MTYESRASALAAAVGADIKSLTTQTYNQKMLPTGIKQTNIPRTLISATVTSLASARLSLVLCPVKAGETYSGISFFSVNAAAVPLNQLFSLYTTSLTLIGTTASDGTTAWAANSRKRLALTTPYTPTEDGYVYAGISVQATTVPTLAGTGSFLQLTNWAPILHGSSSSGVNSVGTHPNPAAAPTALLGVPAVMLD